MRSDLAIQRISLNTGIPPDWQALFPYLEEYIHEGMPKSEVLKELDKVGPYVIGPEEPQGECDRVDFHQWGTDGGPLYSLWFCFEDDESETLNNFGVISD